MIITLLQGLASGVDCSYTLDIRWVTSKPKPNRSADHIATRPQLHIVHNAISRSLGSVESAEVELLSYYRRCVTNIPSTKADSILNPLHLILPLVVESESLRSAVISLAAVHRRRSTLEWLRYKNKALSSFYTTFNRFDNGVRLAIILVLLFGQAAESARGAWRVHLSAVQSILDEMCQNCSPEEVLRNDLLRAITIQCFWWDTIGALLSLQKPVLSSGYLEACLDINRTQDRLEWRNFTYDSMGCPEEMFFELHRLASGTVDSPHFFLDLKSRSFEELRADGLSVDAAIDHMHTSRTWKYGAALYVSTRFSLPSDQPNTVRMYVRHVFDHATSLKENMPLRKQILFPLVIAGSCTDVAEERKFISEYCISCYRETRFELFTSGLGISEAAWARRDQEIAKHGVASSCWKDITATDDQFYDMLG
jgi:hypothetical protein